MSLFALLLFNDHLLSLQLEELLIVHLLLLESFQRLGVEVLVLR